MATQKDYESYLDQSARDTYDYRRQASAKETLDKSIALNAAKQNAAKALQGQLAASGMAQSGYAQSQASGIQNAYLNSLASIQNEGSSELASINAEEAQANAAAKDKEQSSYFSSLTEGIGASASPEQATAFLKGAGISIDDDGNMYGEGWDRLSDTDKRILGAYYSSIQSMPTSSSFSSAADMLENIQISGGVEASDDRWGIGDEVVTLYRYPNVFNQEGTVVKLENGNSSNAAYVVYRNGKWHATSAAAYKTADEDHRRWIKGDSLDPNSFADIRKASQSKN